MMKQELTLKLRTNRAIRFLAYPFEIVRRKILQHEFLKSPDSDYLKGLHNSYQGQRCFVIGNGPSLLPEDLDKLKDEITFACNRIYHIYPRTDWRPTFYLSIDVDNLSAEIVRIKESGTYTKFINFKARRLGRVEKDNLWYIYPKGKFYLNNDTLDSDVALSKDISHHSTQNATSVVTAIEMAIYMGFKTIILLGVDNNYTRKIGKDGKVYIDATVKTSYFNGMKDWSGKEGDQGSTQNVEKMNLSYEICKSFAEENEVQILNATRGGKLEIFPRVSFDEIISLSSV